MISLDSSSKMSTDAFLAVDPGEVELSRQASREVGREEVFSVEERYSTDSKRSVELARQGTVTSIDVEPESASDEIEKVAVELLSREKQWAAESGAWNRFFCLALCDFL
eukprot:TRINITY_DN3503_c0_g1_i3.p2 TRINITY_DN3503_c0_g1~~TRINITY_DN3503_c0_g1_i3.p2  ORF type:complete len:109 (-),score=8.42 TRINITY_DN3503_c0_g1_i3:78-404(-)